MATANSELQQALDALQAGREAEAFDAFTRATEHDPRCVAGWQGRGEVLLKQGKFAQAGAQFQQALRVDADHPASHLGLAQALFQFGRVEQALEHLDRVTGRTEGQAELLAALYAPGASSVTPAGSLARRRTYAATLAPVAGQPAPRHPRREGPLRVGYLSAHFDLANYMKPVWGLVNQHDRTAFHLTFFSDASGDPTVAGYASHVADRWIDVRELDNPALTERIRAEELDLLVDLNAYSYVRRLPLWSAPVAPVNVAWFNMYATSGLPGIQYLIGDRHVVEPGESTLFSEQVIALTHSYLTFRVLYDAPEVSLPEQSAGPGPTLGCLAPMYKVTDVTLAAWAELLRRLPRARLLLRNAALGQPSNRQFIASRLQEAGIPLDRTELQGPADHYKFLRTYEQVDLALDTFPYNGGSTTMEALWQGVPVACFHGDRWAARISASLIREAGLDDFVADSPQAHIEQVTAFVDSPAALERLRDLRRAMRGHLLSRSVCDTAGMAREMEAVYRRLTA